MTMATGDRGDRGRLPLKLPEIDWEDIRKAPDSFDESLDIFGLKKFAKRLANLVEGVELPFTLLLDGKWGTGKSVFIKQWAVFMERE